MNGEGCLIRYYYMNMDTLKEFSNNLEMFEYMKGAPAPLIRCIPFMQHRSVIEGCSRDKHFEDIDLINACKLFSGMISG